MCNTARLLTFQAHKPAMHRPCRLSRPCRHRHLQRPSRHLCDTTSFRRPRLDTRRFQPDCLPFYRLCRNKCCPPACCQALFEASEHRPRACRECQARRVDRVRRPGRHVHPVRPAQARHRFRHGRWRVWGCRLGRASARRSASSTSRRPRPSRGQSRVSVRLARQHRPVRQLHLAHPDRPHRGRPCHPCHPCRRCKWLWATDARTRWCIPPAVRPP